MLRWTNKSANSKSFLSVAVNLTAVCLAVTCNLQPYTLVAVASLLVSAGILLHS